MSFHWFVRHGESVANANGWLAGHRDVPLTERGIAQASALKEVLAGIRPDRVVCSDLIRAKRTAELAWEGRTPEPIVAPALRERHLGAWEGAPIEQLRANGSANVLLSWEYGPPNGESHRALAIRALRYLALQDDGADVLWFGHGGWIRTVVGLLDAVPVGQIGSQKVANTELLARRVQHGTWARLLLFVTESVDRSNPLG